MALVLKTLRSNQTLDLRGLGVGLRALLLAGNLTTNDELANLQSHMLVSNLYNSTEAQTQSAPKSRTGEEAMR